MLLPPENKKILLISFSSYSSVDAAGYMCIKALIRPFPPFLVLLLFFLSQDFFSFHFFFMSSYLLYSIKRDGSLLLLMAASKTYSFRRHPRQGAVRVRHNITSLHRLICVLFKIKQMPHHGFVDRTPANSICLCLLMCIVCIVVPPMD